MFFKTKNGLTINLVPGLGFTGILTLIFVVAKIFNKIAWSWWWVFCPLWAPVALVLSVLLGIFGGGLLVIFITELIKSVFKKKARYKFQRRF